MQACENSAIAAKAFVRAGLSAWSVGMLCDMYVVIESALRAPAVEGAMLLGVSAYALVAMLLLRRVHTMTSYGEIFHMWKPNGHQVAWF